MTQRKNLSVNSTEFDTIKANLKEFLRGQEQFKDYDFEGSGLAVLLDVLAYNTFYQAFYNNVVANEIFLDSAVKRSSVVSHAKSLGYTPSSKTAATAVVDVTLGSAPSSSVLLPGAQFTTTINSKTYTFVNTESAEINFVDANTPAITELIIKEGSLSSASYIVPDAANNTKYLIPDKNVDISTVKVRVQNSQTDTTGITDTWSRATDLTQVGPTTKTYFIEENTSGFYEITFGDSVIGVKPNIGNLVTITYLITNGPVANGAGNNDTTDNRSFVYLNGSNDVSVISAAVGGTDKENIDSIRFKAPRVFSAQNRAVTKGDYSALVSSNFNGFDSVFVFGGEEAIPPAFGTVFVVLKPASGTIVSDAVKSEVQDFLESKAVLSISPIVIDPDYTYLRFMINVFYDKNKTTLSSGAITNSIRTKAIQNLNDNLGKFSQSFSVSRLLTDIDAASTSIDSSDVDVVMEKRLVPTSTTAVSYEFRFGNPIFHPATGYPSVLSSNQIQYLDPTDNTTKQVFVEDDGDGIVSLYQLVNNMKVVVLNNAGSVDYDNGIVRLNSMQLASPNNDPFVKLFAQADNQRYVSKQDKILLNDYLLDDTAILISVNGIEQETSVSIDGTT